MRPAPSASSTPVPAASFLAAYASQGAFTDCYTTSIPGAVGLPEFVLAFYTTPIFKLERWLLARALRIASSDHDALLLAQGQTERFSAWKVERRSGTEILMDAGQTRSWLSVEHHAGPDASTTLLFGSAVVPMRPGGRFGLAFHALLGFHRLYSKVLLASASRRVLALRKRRGAA